MRKQFISSAFAIAVVLFTGCANHLKDITKEFPENSRSVLGKQYILTPEKEIPDTASFKVTLSQVEKIRVTVYQVRKYSSLYTPYQGWRESYEILAGICLFPVAIVSNVLSVFTFSMFPFSWSAAVTKYSFDGMNPCMNFESSSRMEEVPVKVERSQVDSYEETKQKLLGGEWMIVKTGDDVYARIKTDQTGQAEIILLSTDLEQTKALDSRYLNIYLEKNNVSLKKISISRRFLSRLSSARKHMMKYYSAPSGAELASCIKSLENLSFETLALQLEEKELRKHPDFKESFEKNIK